MQGLVLFEFQAYNENVMHIPTPTQKWRTLQIPKYSCWHTAYFVKKELPPEAQATLREACLSGPDSWPSQDLPVLSVVECPLYRRKNELLGKM